MQRGETCCACGVAPCVSFMENPRAGALIFTPSNPSHGPEAAQHQSTWPSDPCQRVEAGWGFHPEKLVQRELLTSLDLLMEEAFQVQRSKGLEAGSRGTSRAICKGPGAVEQARGA